MIFGGTAVARPSSVTVQLFVVFSLTDRERGVLASIIIVPDNLVNLIIHKQPNSLLPPLVQGDWL